MNEALEYGSLGTYIGCEIRTSKECLLSGKRARDILAALQSWAVVVIPGVEFTNKQLEAFSNTLGEISGKVFRMSKNPDLNPSTWETVQDGGTEVWHMDGVQSLRGPIPEAALLYCQEPYGETWFANTVAAYEGMGTQQYDNWEVYHSVAHQQLTTQGWMNNATIERYVQMGNRIAPLVKKFENGDKGFWIGTHAARTLGMDHNASLLGLTRILNHCTKEEYVYRHKWQPRDLVLYANQRVVHKASPYPNDARRLLLRVELKEVHHAQASC